MYFPEFRFAWVLSQTAGISFAQFTSLKPVSVLYGACLSAAGVVLQVLLWMLEITNIAEVRESCSQVSGARSIAKGTDVKMFFFRTCILKLM